MNKRGISPLIATVLLVAFSIALAAIVSTYVITKTKEFKPQAIIEDSLLCDNVALDYAVESSGGSDILSYLDMRGGLFVLKGLKIVNKGSFNVHKYVITAPGAGTIEQFAGYYNDNCDVFTKEELRPNDDTSTSDVTENKLNTCIGLKNTADKLIKITPIMQDPETGEFVKCNKRQLIIDHDKLCKDIGNPGCTPLI